MVQNGDFVLVRMTGWAYEEPTVLEMQQGKKEPKLVMIETTEKEHAEKEHFPSDQISAPKFVIVGEKEFALDGVNEALREMDVGEEKEIELPPESAFGERDKSKIETIPSKKLREQGQWPVKRGQWVRFEGRVGKVLSVGGGRVNIDFNHPHAGKKVKYWLKIEKVIEDEVEKIEQLLSHYVNEAFAKAVTIENNDGNSIELKIPDYYLYQSPQLILVLNIVANRLNKCLNKQKVRYVIEYSFATPEADQPESSESESEEIASTMESSSETGEHENSS